MSTIEGTAVRRVTVACLAASTTLVFATALAQATPDVLAADDQYFMESLERQGVMYSFNLEKMQAQRYCATLISGTDKWRIVTAVDDLARNGGYSLDAANAISIAASQSYCNCAYWAAGAASNVYVNAAGIPIGPKPKLPPASSCKPFELDYARQNGIVIPTEP